MVPRTLHQRMSNKWLTTLTLLNLLIMVAMAATKRQGVINECKRSLALLEPDVVIYTNDITFTPGKEDRLADGRVMFEYVVAEDYRDTIALIEA